MVSAESDADQIVSKGGKLCLLAFFYFFFPVN